MTKDEWRRIRTCTRKRAFSTRPYAELFLKNELKNKAMEVYECRFCFEFHIGHPKRNAKRFRQKNKIRNKANNYC